MEALIANAFGVARGDQHELRRPGGESTLECPELGEHPLAEPAPGVPEDRDGALAVEVGERDTVAVEVAQNGSGAGSPIARNRPTRGAGGASAPGRWPLPEGTCMTDNAGAVAWATNL